MGPLRPSKACFPSHSQPASPWETPFPPLPTAEVFLCITSSASARACHLPPTFLPCLRGSQGSLAPLVLLGFPPSPRNSHLPAPSLLCAQRRHNLANTIFYKREPAQSAATWLAFPGVKGPGPPAVPPPGGPGTPTHLSLTRDLKNYIHLFHQPPCYSHSLVPAVPSSCCQTPMTQTPKERKNTYSRCFLGRSGDMNVSRVVKPHLSSLVTASFRAAAAAAVFLSRGIPWAQRFTHCYLDLRSEQHGNMLNVKQKPVAACGLSDTTNRVRETRGHAVDSREVDSRTMQHTGITWHRL